MFCHKGSVTERFILMCCAPHQHVHTHATFVGTCSMCRNMWHGRSCACSMSPTMLCVTKETASELGTDAVCSSACAHIVSGTMLATGQLLSSMVVHCRRDSFTTQMTAGKLCGTSLPSTSLRMYRYSFAVCPALHCIAEASCPKVCLLAVMPDLCIGVLRQGSCVRPH